MSKYMCICGQHFRNKKYANKHVSLFVSSPAQGNDQNDIKYHFIVKKTLKGRLVDFLLEFPFDKFCRVVAIYILGLLIVRHYKIDLNMWESLWAGLAIGLLG